MKRICLTLAAFSVFAVTAETLTFTPKVNVNGQWTWANKENWLTSGGGNKAPAEGDDLVIDTPANNYHAANGGVEVTSLVGVKHGRYTLIRTTGENTITVAGETPLAKRLTVASDDPAERKALEAWTLVLSADKRELQLDYNGGMAVILR